MSGNVEVKTFATLRSLYPSIPSFPLEEGDTVGDVMDRMKLPREKVTIIFINNKHGEETSSLYDGDVLGLFPPIGGG